ncbi:MAG: TolC family protein [Balneolaceae bacterium]|nr:MAG: TolC family protein [Balneolaceae bacterium]
MKYVMLIMSVCFLATAAVAQQGNNDRDALQNHIHTALENNPGLKAASRSAEAARLEAPQFGRLSDPMLEVEYDVWSRENMDRLELMLMQRVPWFGTLGANRRYFDRLADAEDSAVLQVRNELIRDVKLSWYSMHEAYHHIMVLEQNVELLGQVERQILIRLETGRASQVDLIRLEIERDELMNNIENYRDQLQSEKARFNALLNREIYAEVALFHDLTLMEFSAERDITENPAVTEIEQQQEAAEINVERARLNSRPDFNVGVGFMNRDFGIWDPDRFNAVMVRVEVGLPFSRTRYRAEQEQARIQSRLRNDIRNETVNRLNAQASATKREIETSRRAISLYRDQLIPSLNHALDLSLENYGTGRATFEEIIQLYRQILTLEMNLNEAETAYNRAVSELEFLYGSHIIHRN